MIGGKHRKDSFSNKIVAAAIVAIVAFTVAVFALAFYNVSHMTNVAIPTELIVAWYAFWTVELVSLASIKKDKIKNKYEK